MLTSTPRSRRSVHARAVSVPLTIRFEQDSVKYVPPTLNATPDAVGS